MVSFAPSFFDGFENWLNLAVHDINHEHREMVRRRLIEPAVVNGVMRPAGYVFDNDGSAGPHRRNEGEPFAYHPQFEEFDDSPVVKPGNKMATRRLPMLQGLSSAMDKLVHDLEFEAQKVHKNVQEVGTHGIAIIADAGKHVASMNDTVDEVKKYLAEIAESTNGAPTSGDSSTDAEPPASDSK